VAEEARGESGEWRDSRKYKKKPQLSNWAVLAAQINMPGIASGQRAVRIDFSDDEKIHHKSFIDVGFAALVFVHR